MKKTAPGRTLRPNPNKHALLEGIRYKNDIKVFEFLRIERVA